MNYKNNPLAVRLYKYLSVARIPSGHTLELLNTKNNIVVLISADGDGRVISISDGATKFFRKSDQPTLEDVFERAYNSGILEPLCPKRWNPYDGTEKVYVHHHCLRHTEEQWMDYSDSKNLPKEYVAFVNSLDEPEKDFDKPSCFDVFYAHCFNVGGLWYGAVNFEGNDYWTEYIFIFNLDVPIPLPGESLSHTEIHIQYLVPAVKAQYDFFEMFLEQEMAE